ncbi:MAG: CHASE2 domain-containing protein, partial [Candidatus Krumholzibacteria bacterium]|nr:CHASE2 domain-containing protein [Candidatus Krumholzibacteria bacterium]
MLRRLLPLLLLIPISYSFRPLFWTPLDHRFYNYFQSKRPLPPWEKVVVVGIDEATVDRCFERPVYPLSRHVSQHVLVTDCLADAGAAAIIFDLELSEEMFLETPALLAEAFRRAGTVYLIKSVHVSRRRSARQEEIVTIRETLPHPMLVSAARGAYISPVELDTDGRFRRYRPRRMIEGSRYEGLPEVLAGFSGEDPVPIDTPSRDVPVPVVSYKDIVSKDPAACGDIAGRIVFVGSLVSSSNDFVMVAREAMLPDGRMTRNIPGVIALAAITENLARIPDLRDAPRYALLLWLISWSVLAVILLPRRKPAFSAAILVGIAFLSLALTGLLHVYSGLILPAGFLLGTLFICGIYTVITLNLQTIRELYAEEAEISRVQKEMETARAIQVSFLPAEIPRWPG